MNIPPLMPDQVLIFSAIYAHPRRSVAQAAALTGMSPAKAGKIVLRLERLGLVESIHWSAPSPRWGGRMRRQRLCSPAPWVLA